MELPQILRSGTVVTIWCTCNHEFEASPWYATCPECGTRYDVRIELEEVEGNALEDGEETVHEEVVWRPPRLPCIEETRVQTKK